MLNIRLFIVLGTSLVLMAVVSVVIFASAIEGGIEVYVEKDHVTAFKGEEYETVLSIESRAADWIGSLPTTFSIETGQLTRVDPIGDGKKLRLRFLGKYAGRTEGITVGVSLSDPLKLLHREQRIVQSEFVLDILPLSLLAPVAPGRVTTFGYGDQTAGYPGPGQELYGLVEYHSGGDTKDIIWKRVARSPDEKLVARIREASVKEFIRAGVIQFAEREDARAAWVDKLCEALAHVGKEAIELGTGFAILYHSSPEAAFLGTDEIEEERSLGLTRARATGLKELAEAVMTCSVASGSREIETVVRDSDFLITGLREMEDQETAASIAGKPAILIYEEGASPPKNLGKGSIIYTGRENLLPMLRMLFEGHA